MLFLSLFRLSYGVDTVPYTYVSNFKGLMSIPPGDGPFPAVIFNYDEFWDWVGHPYFEKQGMGFSMILQQLNDLGYVGFVPVERYRKRHAILGAISYLKQHSAVDSQQIHLLGQSEGAFISMLVAEDFPEIRSLVLITPVSLNFTGYFSFPGLLRKLSHLNMPILLLYGDREKEWRIRESKLVARVLNEQQKDVKVNVYPAERKWFWNIRHQFMRDIIAFWKDNGSR